MSNQEQFIGRFLPKVKVLDNGCWQWQGGKSGNGYGRFNYDDKLQPAHRFAYTYFYNQINLDLTIDHLCRNTSCVNPKHLEQVTLKENILRGNSPGAINARKTHCCKGHSFSDENLHILPNGERRCKECNREKAKEYQRKRRQNYPEQVREYERAYRQRRKIVE